MAFNIGYVGLCDQNIRHIYTTTDIRPAATRQPKKYKPEFLAEMDRKRRDRMNNRRFMEYSPRHDIELPRAPAFRSFEEKEISGIVSRLTMPAKERFNFKFPVSHEHNDWQRADFEKKQRLLESLRKFGPSYGRRNRDFKGQDIQKHHDRVEKIPSITD